MHPRWGQIREKIMMSLCVTAGVFPISLAQLNGPLPVAGSKSVIGYGSRTTTPGTFAALNPSGVYWGYFCVNTKYLESQGLATSRSVATAVGSPFGVSPVVGAYILNFSTLGLWKRNNVE